MHMGQRLHEGGTGNDRAGRVRCNDLPPNDTDGLFRKHVRSTAPRPQTYVMTSSFEVTSYFKTGFKSMLVGTQRNVVRHVTNPDAPPRARKSGKTLWLWHPSGENYSHLWRRLLPVRTVGSIHPADLPIDFCGHHHHFRLAHSFPLHQQNRYPNLTEAFRRKTE